MEVALEKLQRSSEGMAPEEFTPELQALLGFASCMKDCEETLKGVAQRVQEQGGGTDDLECQPDVFKARALLMDR